MVTTYNFFHFWFQCVLWQYKYQTLQIDYRAWTNARNLNEIRNSDSNNKAAVIWFCFWIIYSVK